MEKARYKIERLSICIFAGCVLMFVMTGYKNLDKRDVFVKNTANNPAGVSENSLVTEEIRASLFIDRTGDGGFKVTDTRNFHETLSYNCAADFIEDCGFEVDDLFWEYHYERWQILILYYNEFSKEGCVILYKSKKDYEVKEGVRFRLGSSEDAKYSLMEAWRDLDNNSTLSCIRTTGRKDVSEYKETVQYQKRWPNGLEYFLSKGIVDPLKNREPSFLIEITCSYSYKTGKIWKREYRHNPLIFGKYRSSADYYYGDEGRLLYQEFANTGHGGGEVYYIYGEGEEPFPEFYLYIGRNREITEVDFISYDSEIPAEDNLNMDEEMILAKIEGCAPIVEFSHYDKKGYPVFHLYEVVVHDDESHTATWDWLTFNPELGIAYTFWYNVIDYEWDLKREKEVKRLFFMEENKHFGEKADHKELKSD